MSAGPRADPARQRFAGSLRGSVYVGMAGGRLLALRIDNGGLIWDASVTVPGGRSGIAAPGRYRWRSDRARWWGIRGDLPGRGGRTEQSSGRVAWRRKLSSYSRMAADRNGLYVGDADGVIWGLDLRSGAARWSQMRSSVAGFQILRWSTAWWWPAISRVTRIGWIMEWQPGGAHPPAVTRSPPGCRWLMGSLYVQGDGGELTAVRLPSR